MDNKFWIVLVVLFSVNLIASDLVNVDGALIDVEISREINSKRRWGTSEIELGYAWEFENRQYTALITIDNQQYNKKRNQRQRRGYNTQRFLPPMVYEGTKALQKLVDEFKRVIPRNWEPERRVNFVLAFVHAIPWTDDEKTTGYREFYKYPIETLTEGKGDCEDTSMLLAAILNGLRFEVALIDLPGHIAVGVKGDFQGDSVLYGNDKYYYCETTRPGRRLGKMPKQHKGKEVTVIPITSEPIKPAQVTPQIVPPNPRTPILFTPQKYLQDGIKLYGAARYNEAIKSLRLALRGLDNSEQQAEAYIYLGAAEFGFGMDRSEVKARFREALRQNPNQELPWRGHPRFEPLIKEVRRESIGELTVSASLPQTKIWIYGNGIKRKNLGTGTISLKLFKGTYTVEGIYKGRPIKKTVKITPNSHKELEIEIPSPVIDDSPPRIILLDPVQTAQVNQQITLEAKVTDNTSIGSVYLFYGFSQSKNSQPLVYRQKKFVKSYATTYMGSIPPQSEAGYIWYYLTATDGVGNQSQSRKRTLEIKSSRENPPRIVLLDSEQTVETNQQIVIRAQITGDTFIKSVLLFYGFSRFGSEPSVYNRKRHTRSYSTKSARYTGSIPAQSEAGYIWYYLTATDEKGNQSQSEKRLLEIIKAELPNKLVEVEPPNIPVKPAPKPARSFVVSKSKSPRHEGIWVNHAWLGNVFENGTSAFDWSSGDTLSFAYLREGKTHQTFGAQLDVSYHNSTDSSAMLQWGPALGKSPIAFTFLGGVTGYKISDSDRFETTRTSPAVNRDVSDASSYITPVLGASLKLYPLDSIAVDATGSLKLPSVFDATYLHHYEIGMRIYIARPLNLEIGYGQWYIGSRSITRMQIGLGFTF